MSIREAQLELTRERIIEAFLDASREPGGAKVTVAEVARRSGTSPATIYRHFADRDALVSAAAHHRLTSAQPPASVWGMAEFDAHLRELWRELATNIAVAREGVLSDAGREMRVARFHSLRDDMRHLFESYGIDADAPESRLAVGAIAVLSGAPALIDMHDRQGLSADEAVDVAMWSIGIVFEQLGIDASQLAFEQPLPNLEEAT